MEASALQAPAALTQGRVSLRGPLLRLRSDEQLVALFRAGHQEAFQAIHDRYRARLFAYTRQMLSGSSQDAEDALQDVFVRAYSGLRANDRELALRAWLYRIAHNRCIDQLRRPAPLASDTLERAEARVDLSDPCAAAEQREALRRLIADVRRLPEQQRSALLMRELSGMSYLELADALGLSVPAVKSLLVRARVGLAAAAEARDTACSAIREELANCHERGVRPTSNVRRHLSDCEGCREFRASVRLVSRNLAAVTPAIGPLGILAKLLGLGAMGSGAAASGSSAAAGGSGAAVTGGAAVGAVGAMGAGGALATGVLTGTSAHIAALLTTAVIAAGGAAAIQPVLAPAHHRVPARGHATAAAARGHAAPGTPAGTAAGATDLYAAAPGAPAGTIPASPTRIGIAPARRQVGSVGGWGSDAAASAASSMAGASTGGAGTTGDSTGSGAAGSLSGNGSGVGSGGSGTLAGAAGLLLSGSGTASGPGSTSGSTSGSSGATGTGSNGSGSTGASGSGSGTSGTGGTGSGSSGTGGTTTSGSGSGTTGTGSTTGTSGSGASGTSGGSTTGSGSTGAGSSTGSGTASS